VRITSISLCDIAAILPIAIAHRIHRKEGKEERHDLCAFSETRFLNADRVRS
jgi:hypothetical protein